MTSVLHIDQFADLTKMPAAGPFLVTWAFNCPRIEHAPGPARVGCPRVPCPRLNQYRERHCIPRGDDGARWLNKLWAQGAFEWNDDEIVPKEPEDYVPEGLSSYVLFSDIARDRIDVPSRYSRQLIGKLGFGLRWWNTASSSETIMIHPSDVEECVRLWRLHYTTTGLKQYPD